MNARPTPIFPPLADATPAMARAEFAKARYFLQDRNEFEALDVLSALAKRYRRLQANELLGDDDNIVSQLWDAVATSGMGDRLSDETIYQTINNAMQSVDAAPLGDENRIKTIKATPYQWMDSASIPMREWVYGKTLIRKFVTTTVAPGGVGKSSLIAAETMAMVSGKPLLGVAPAAPLKVWLWNLEDPSEETTRKLQALAMHYEIDEDDIRGRLFSDSGRDQPLVITQTTRNGTAIAKPVVDSIASEMIERGIDVLVIDPFVSCHDVPENDNSAIDLVAKEWGKVADRANAAVHLVHHTRKGKEEITTESSRGGKALTDACRIVRAINPMTKEEGERAGVENHRLFFRCFNDKANLSPPADQSNWFKLVSVDLGNGPMLGMGGDQVGVVTTWEWPDALAGVTGGDFDKAAAIIRAGKWRENVQSSDWVGKAIAQAMDLDIEEKSDKERVKGIVKAWRAAGTLIIVEGEDDKRNKRKFVEVREDD